MRECSCGSGEISYPIYDAQRIYLCRVCEKCEAQKLEQYPAWVINGYDQSDIDEPIEGD